MIDADALVARFSLWLEDDNYADGNTYADIAEDFIIPSINEAETIEVEPVKRGKWIRERRPCIFSQTGSADWLTCSVCGERFSTTEVNKEKYCRNCGVKMEYREEVDE